MASPLFRVGDIVLVDNKDKAYIIEIDIQAIVDGSILYKVRFVVSNQEENDVEQGRCKIATILSSPETARNSRSSLNRHSPPPPSSISPSSTSSNATTRVPVYDNLNQAIKQSRQSVMQSDTNIPLLQFLRDNDSKGKGWLRQILPFNSGKSQLNEHENSLFVFMTSIFLLHSPSSGIAIGWVGLLANAWGVNVKKINRQLNAFVDSDFTCTQKQRSDKGKTIFNDEKKRKATFTAFNHFKKAKHQEFRESTERLDHDELKREYNALTDGEKAVYENEATLNLERSRHLWEELKIF